MRSRWSAGGSAVTRRVTVIVVLAMVLAIVEPPAGAQTSHSWAIAHSVNQGNDTNFLYGVSCPSATSCTAVGFYTSPGVDRTLIESWNGAAWKVVASPSPGGVWNFLYGVSCTSADACTAVGRYENPNGTNRTLIETWDGATWKVAPSPNRGSAANVLSAVWCASTVSCVAVGSSQVGASTRTLVETWNGHTWALDASSANHAPSSDNSLAGVSCAAARSCTAVGSYVDPHGVPHTLVESWNGTRWSIVPSRDNGPDGSTLTGVSCLSATSCQAVGTYEIAGFDTGLLPRTLVESWNGTKWSIGPSPNRGTSANAFTGVSCVSATACKAVGWYQTHTAGVHQTLTETWNGKTWRIVGSPNPVTSPATDNYLGVRGSALNAVACRAVNVCRSAGFYVDIDGHDRALIESYT